MSLLKNTQAASLAVDLLATTPGTSAGDRAQQLSMLRIRVDAQIRAVSAEAEHALGSNPVSQREGD